MLSEIKKIFTYEASSGILLLLTLLLVLIIANTPLFIWYEKLTYFPISIHLGSLQLNKSLEAWVNEGLMAIFFMLLALEMKREILDGELSKISRLLLPIITAVAGILLPIIIFFLVAEKNAIAIRGWAIATTTDIALVLGVMAMLGKRVPVSLKIMMIALSVVDDVVAIVLIAVYYNKDLSMPALIAALIAVLLLILLNIANVRNLTVYMFVGILMWLAVLQSGVHATLAGILLGYCIPYKSLNNYSPLKYLERKLRPWSAYLIMPVFILVNGGIHFVGVPLNLTFSATPMAIVLGLFLGKQVGIFLTACFLIKFTKVRMPTHATWLQLYGVAVLTGIGFTMSLFLSTLAYHNTYLTMVSKQGVLIGSSMSGLWGVFILLIAHQKHQKDVS